MKKKLVVITTGGTGGHVFPAIALVNTLINNNYNVSLLLDKRASVYVGDLKALPSLEIKTILSLGLHYKSVLFILKMIMYLSVGFMQSFFYLLKNRPVVIVSFGSYACIPVVCAGIILNIPIIMHEQNSYLGKAHKIFVKYARHLLISFENTKNIPAFIKPIFTGLPIRQNILSLMSTKQIKLINENQSDSVITLGIFGGSQGAKIFAESIPLAVAKLEPWQQSRLQVFHQCREDLISQTTNLWYNTKANFVIKSFFSDMDKLLLSMDVAIARSGASSIYEFSVAGCFVLYVPFARATDNHQYFNAIYAKEKLGADILLEQDFNVDNIYSFLNKILSDMDDVNKRQKMAKINCKDNALEDMINLIKAI